MVRYIPKSWQVCFPVMPDHNSYYHSSKIPAIFYQNVSAEIHQDEISTMKELRLKDVIDEFTPCPKKMSNLMDECTLVVLGNPCTPESVWIP